MKIYIFQLIRIFYHTYGLIRCHIEDSTSDISHIFLNVSHLKHQYLELNINRSIFNLLKLKGNVLISIKNIKLENDFMKTKSSTKLVLSCVHR